MAISRSRGGLWRSPWPSCRQMVMGPSMPDGESTGDVQGQAEPTFSSEPDAGHVRIAHDHVRRAYAGARSHHADAARELIGRNHDGPGAAWWGIGAHHGQAAAGRARPRAGPYEKGRRWRRFGASA